jgi:restriction system protein
MPIPEFYQFMRPALQIHESGGVKPIAYIANTLADHFSLSQEERQELLPSGRTTRLYSRVYWALTYLHQAKLIESVGRGINQITERGKGYLAEAPEIIKPADLMIFPEFVIFQNKHGNSAKVPLVPFPSILQPSVDVKTTPEEDMDATYQILKDTLAQEVLEHVKSMPPAFFERLIVKLLLRLGYGGGTEDAGQTLGQSGDGGVDGVIYQDKLGLDKIYLQAKRWSSNSVGPGEVQAFVGALVGKGATKGVFITTSTFTSSAKNYAENNHTFKISLVDGTELARLMIDYDLGVSLVQRYDVKRIDSDFFADD